MTDGIDDTIEIEPRPFIAVARRVTILVAFLRRAALEAPDEHADEAEAFMRETDRFELYSWLRREAAEDMAAPERSILATPAGDLDEDPVDQCLLAAVPARALAWSLGAIDGLSPADRPDTHVDVLSGWAPEPWDDISRWARKLALRPDETLAEERERWELWHWRATLTRDDLDPGEDFAQVVADVARDAEASGLVQVTRDDFAIDSQPFSALDADQREAVAVLAEGYLHALNWACGFGDDWHDVPLYPE